MPTNTPDSAAWFVDGSYLFKCWQALQRPDKLDYKRLRDYLEATYCDSTAGERIGDAYYFNADPDPPSAKMNSFHSALSFPPPNGPGLRVKLYWLHRKELFWPASMGGGRVVHPTNGQGYILTTQKAVDVSLSFHLMRSYSNRRWRKLFLAAGDGDFHEAIQHLVEYEDIQLVLIGTIDTISDELKPYANAIVHIDQKAIDFARP